MNSEKGSSDISSHNYPLDAEMQEFLDSVSIEEELKDFICQPLTPDPFLEYSFPFYEKLLRNSLAIMPRQSFGNDFAVEQSLALVQELGDGQLNIKWTLSVPFIKEKNAEETAGLFYKIELLVIRPKIRNLFTQNNLRRGLSLGSLSNIANQIGIQQKEINKVIKALEYGSQIELQIRIESTRKLYEGTNLCEEKLFKCYNLHFAETITSSDKASKHRQSKNNRSNTSATKTSKMSNNQATEKAIIYPSATYLYILLAMDNILGSSLEKILNKNSPSLKLRTLEIESLLTAINPNINLKGTDTLQTVAALIPISIERLQESN